MKTLHKLITGLSKYIILSSVIKRWRYLGPNSRVCISCSFVFDLGKKNLSSLEFLLFIKLMWRKLDWSDSDLAYLRWKHVAGDFWTGRYLSHLVFDKAEPNQLWKSDFPFFPIFSITHVRYNWAFKHAVFHITSIIQGLQSNCCKSS